MAGECDNDINKEEIKSEKKFPIDVVRDENLLEDILVNPHPKNKTNKNDPLAELLNVSLKF